MPRSKKRSLRDLTLAPLTVDDRAAMFDELLSGTDRSTALVGCSMVDSTLVQALITKFVAIDETALNGPFYSETAPLSSFSSRVKIARAMGIYGAVLHSRIDIIRRICNVFAHSIHSYKFTDEIIAKECSKLPNNSIGPIAGAHNISPPREWYISACVTSVYLLAGVAYKHSGRPASLDLPDHVYP